MIAQEYIDQLLEHCDISHIIRNRLTLTRKGQEWSALCPFHQEKTPSFTVVPHKKIYYCFGCHNGGNAIQFIKNYHNINFVDAVSIIAKESNYPLFTLNDQDQAFYNNQKQVLDLLACANDYFQQQLKLDTTARAYLKKRTLSTESINTFQLGYAPQNDKQLLKKISQSFAKEHLKDSGLLQKKNHQCLFFNRLTFPIHNEKGHIIAFGARSLNQQPPKYINSPQTTYYHKKNNLYGLFQALQTTKKIKSLFIVEGYLDVIMMAQHGIPNVVATLGTAITVQQIKKAIYYTSTLIFCFDGDRAGTQAAWKTVEILLPLMHQGINSYFLFLPQGQDPDSTIRQHGKPYFIQAFKQAQTLEQVFFDHLTKQYPTKTMSEKTIFSKACEDYIQKIPEGVFKELIKNKLANMIDLNPNQLPSQQKKLAHPVQKNTNPTISPQLKKLYALIVQHPQLIQRYPQPSPTITKYIAHHYPTLMLLIQTIQVKKINSLANLMTVTDPPLLNNLIKSSAMLTITLAGISIEKELYGLCLQFYITIINVIIKQMLEQSKTPALSEELKQTIVQLMQEKNNYIAIRSSVD
jgi:DNA primase